MTADTTQPPAIGTTEVLPPSNLPPQLFTATEALYEAIGEVPSIRETYGERAAGMKELAKYLKTLGTPKYLRGDVLQYLDADRLYGGTTELNELLLEEHLLDVVMDWKEFVDLRHFRIEFAFYTHYRLRNRCVLLGLASKIPEKTRLLWPVQDVVAPHARIELSLPYWLLADKHHRMRLLHHELMHFEVDFDEESGDPNLHMRTHDVEEFIKTTERFGPMNEGQAKLAVAAVQSPGARECFRSWGFVQDNAQGLLFKQPSPPASAHANRTL